MRTPAPAWAALSLATPFMVQLGMVLLCSWLNTPRREKRIWSEDWDRHKLTHQLQKIPLQPLVLIRQSFRPSLLEMTFTPFGLSLTFNLSNSWNPHTHKGWTSKSITVPSLEDTWQCHLVPRFCWCHFTQHHSWCIHRAHATCKHSSVDLLPSPHGTRAYMQIAVFCAEQRSDNAIQQDSLALSHALLHRWFQERKINSSQPFLIKVTVWRRALFYFHISHSTWTNTCKLQNRG